MLYYYSSFTSNHFNLGTTFKRKIQVLKTFLKSLNTEQVAVMAWCYQPGIIQGIKEWYVIIAEERGKQSVFLRKVITREEYWRVKVDQLRIGQQEEEEEEEEEQCKEKEKEKEEELQVMKRNG